MYLLWYIVENIQVLFPIKPAVGSNGHMQMRSLCMLPNSFFGLYVIDRISSFPLMISIGMAAVATTTLHSTACIG